MLTLYKASTNSEEEADELHGAASRFSFGFPMYPRFESLSSLHSNFDCRGDLEQLKRLIENKVNPNLGEHDKRTALHQVTWFK